MFIYCRSGRLRKNIYSFLLSFFGITKTFFQAKRGRACELKNWGWQRENEEEKKVPRRSESDDEIIHISCHSKLRNKQVSIFDALAGISFFVFSPISLQKSPLHLSVKFENTFVMIYSSSANEKQKIQQNKYVFYDYLIFHFVEAN